MVAKMAKKMRKAHRTVLEGKLVNAKKMLANLRGSARYWFAYGHRMGDLGSCLVAVYDRTNARDWLAEVRRLEALLAA